MLATLVAVGIQGSKMLSRTESDMILALRDRNVPAIRKLMDRQVSLFTVLLDKNSKDSEMPENYIVGTARFSDKSPDTEIKINLERLSKMITYSLSKPAYDPKVLKSNHNDLTKNTIRSGIAPQVYWELHYDTLKNGSLKLQRICEFDHSPKFVW